MGPYPFDAEFFDTLGSPPKFALTAFFKKFARTST
jgi:hypothetical protein